MANTKQAKKMVRKIKKRTSYNRWWKGQIKDAVKSLDSIVADANPDQNLIQKEFSNLQKKVDKAAKNGVIHKNKANRIKSRLNKKLTKTEEK